MLALVTVMLCLFIVSCKPVPEISTTGDVSLSSLSDALTPDKIVVDLLPDNLSQKREGVVTHIVIHFISNCCIDMNNPYSYDGIIKLMKSEGISSHYLIGRDGTPYNLVPLEKSAYHAGKGKLPSFPQYENRLNEHSISIEIMAIGSVNDMKAFFPPDEYNKLNPEFIGFTDAQYRTVNQLIDRLTRRFPDIRRDRKHIIGHSEYNSEKTDPGELFDWSRIKIS